MQIKSPATQYEIHFETLVPVVKMRTLIITIVVVSYVITVVESSLRPSKSKKMPFLLDEELSFDLRRRWQATERDRSMFSKSDGEKYSSKKEEMRKSDHYVSTSLHNIRLFLLFVQSQLRFYLVSRFSYCFLVF